LSPGKKDTGGGNEVNDAGEEIDHCSNSIEVSEEEEGNNMG
jgi:hypothetical protein